MDLTLELVKTAARELDLTVILSSISSDMTVVPAGVLARGTHGAGMATIEPDEAIVSAAEQVLLTTSSGISVEVSPDLFVQSVGPLVALRRAIANHPRAPASVEVLPMPKFLLGMGTTRLAIDGASHLHILGRKQLQPVDVQGEKALCANNA